MAVTATPSQVNAMMITERVTSIFSLLGILFILATFLLGRGFDKPINRLFFFASFSNLGMNIAALIAEDGVSAGQNSSLCQFQAFAIQWFLGVDTLWALCMGFNVYLALFRGWTSERMRRQEWKYFLACYGCSFIPALVYLFVNTKSRGKIYGPALLWCWVSPKWDFLRVATLYGIVWVALLFAWIIYLMAFRKVWNNRHQLQGFFNPFNENPFEGTVTTEVDVTTYARRDSALKPAGHNTTTAPDAELAIPGTEPAPTAGFDPYSVNVEAAPPAPPHRHHRSDPTASAAPDLLRVRALTRTAALRETNPEAWLYARVAFLFFGALLLSWVPSSANRLYALAHPARYSFGLNYAEALVLPLQGFCNALVYAVTSRSACRDLWRSVAGTGGGGGGAVGGKAASGGGKAGDTRLVRFTGRRTSRRLESDESSVASLRRH
ncbi:hypothetical protein HO173_005601 [Letharia columbiana]|uniref:G-protein coupled receptors family 2 profile 2 domain-containing protein n=1 Tax=Letharia columbiana TaxID=112416 RepID=A0A8H6FWD5_9LECA|nr:uncharacterized protein HO173_005601 [Letharia columbiana]KAF6235973.1 hypothetical protein HO173_005601 [Letharia columbiana]